MNERDLIARLERLEGTRGPGVTFGALWKRYYREEARSLRSSRDVARIGRLLLARWGEREAITITAEAAEDYRDARASTITRRDGPPAIASVNREIAQGRRCLQWAVEQRLLTYNPLASVRMPPEDNVRKTKIRTEEELQRLLRLADPTMRALILAQIDCGFRRMEVFTLRWPQIALVRYRSRATGRIEQRPMVELWVTKTKRRRAALSWRTWEAIQALPRAGDYVFCGRQPGRWRRREAPLRPGTHLGPDAALRKFKRLALRAGLRTIDGEPVTFHMLRHSFAYLTRVRDRIPERTAMRQAGWKTRSAYDRYGIGDEDELADMYEIVDQNIDAETDRSRKR